MIVKYLKTKAVSRENCRDTEEKWIWFTPKDGAEEKSHHG
jgi:hypothetical protein